MYQSFKSLLKYYYKNNRFNSRRLILYTLLIYYLSRIKLREKITLLSFSILIILLISLFICYWSFASDQKLNSFLGILLQVYGGFVATLIGVYLSLYLNKKEQTLKDQKKNIVVYISSLQQIYTEIVQNAFFLEMAKDILIKELGEKKVIQFESQVIIMKMESINDKYFVALISSGEYKMIINRSNIVSEVVDCYSNMNIVKESIISRCKHIENEIKFKSSFTKKDITHIARLRNNNLRNINKQIQNSNKALEVISKELEKLGVKIRFETTKTPLPLFGE